MESTACEQRAAAAWNSRHGLRLVMVPAIGPVEETAMNDAVHQLLQVVLQGITWVFRTIETLWVWSWSEISSAFGMTWGELPAWKLAIGIIALVTLGTILFVVFKRGVEAFSTIATAFWTMAVTMAGVLTLVVTAGLFSRGFQWVVASVPDNFWEKFI